MKTKTQIAAIRKKAIAVAAVMLSLGLGAMLISLAERSFGWTFFVWMAGLEGISIGLLGGIGYAHVALGTVPAEWKMHPVAGFFWAILTFWAPIIATFFFGLMLYTTLPDAARPKSSLDGNSGAGMMQCFVTFFNAVGCVWLMVLLVANKITRRYSSPPSVAVNSA